MINKRQFKIRDTKKVMHKIGKHWAVISTLMLGILAGGTTVANVNAKAADTTDNDDQANHQLSNQSVKSAGSTLVSNGGASANSSSVQNRVQAASGANSSVSISSVASTSVSSASLGSNYDMKSSNDDDNVLNRADQIHNNVLSEVAQGNENDNQALQPKANHLLGGHDTQNINNFISDLLNPNNLTHIANDAQETHNTDAYNDIVSKLNANTMTSLANNGATIQQYINYAKAIGNDVSQIASADPSLLSKVNSIMNTVNEAQGGIDYLKTGPFTINSLASALQDPDNLMSPAHQGLSKWMVEGAVEALPNRQQMINATSGMATIASNPTDASNYQNMVNDIRSLNTSNHEDQISALNQLSTDTKTLAKSAGDNVADNLGLDKISNDATSVANNIKISNKLNTLHVGSLFNDVISYVTTNNDYGKLNSLANDAKTDFSNAANASDFINPFTNQLTDVNNAQAPLVKTELTDNQSNPEIANAYTVAKSNAADANNILGDLADLNANNAASNLSNVSQTINNNGSLNAVGALKDIANSASNEATSVSESNAYKGLLNNEFALFSGVVNRINANGFKSAAFSTLVGNVKTDLSNATNVSDFVNDLNGQAGAFNGVTAQNIKGYLNNLKNNPEFSNAYQAVRTSSAAADSILDNLSGMNSNNEVAKLSDIANVAKNNFSNSASFGSLATDATNMQTSVSGTQSIAASMAYSSLLTNHESGLFDAVVNRINANGFNSAAFKTLVGNVENDLVQASNASDFINSLASQDSAFNGTTAQKIKNDLTNFVNNPEFSNAYQAVRTSSDAADSILNDLSGMNSDNEVAKLSDIANVAKNNFSNSASFGSLATDAANMQTSVANVKNETPTEVTNVVHQATQNADNLSDNVTTTKDNIGSLSSNYDGQQASSEVTNAADDANDAKEYAQKAATDALAETGVHFTGLGDGTPDYVEDISRVNNDVSKGNADLTDAKADANLSRVDSELSNLNVNGLFNDVLNYVVSHNDYGKFNQAVTAAKDAFNSKNNVTDFVNDFSNQVAGFTNGNAATVKQVLKDHESDLTSAYQVAKDNSDTVNSALNDLNNLTSTNATDQLNAFHDDLTNNGTFKQLGSLEQVAQVASDQASQIDKINHINSLVNGLINPSFVQNAVQRLVNEPENKRSDFEHLVNDAENELTSNNTVNSFVNRIENDQYFNKFTGNDAETVKSVLNGLNNSSDSSIVNGYYNQVKAQKNNVDSILDDLSKIANDPYKSNASQNKSSLNDIYGTINDNSSLKSIPGFNNVATGINNAESSTTFIPDKSTSTVTPGVQVLDDMLQPILNRIVAKGFNGSAFQNAINAVETNIKNANTLSDLWNAIQSNPGVQYFVGIHGNLTQSVISKLSDTNSPLEAAYKAGHQDSAMTQILNDLSDISKHQQVGNNEVAQQSDVDDVNRDLSDINNQINRSNTLKSINGMTTLMNNVHYNHISVKKSATPKAAVKPDVSSVAPLISKALNRMTAANFDSRDFDNVITAIKNNIGSAPSLSALWSDIDNNQSGVKHFTGSLDHDITAILNNGNGQTMKALNAAYHQAHTDNNVTSILNDLQKIADNHLDANDVKAQNGKRDAIRQALTDVKSQLGNSALKSIKGVDQIASDVKSGINAKQYQDQDQPHYSTNKTFNNLLKGLINPSLIKSLSDKLASADFAKSSDRPVFNQIISDLKSLPNNSDPNSSLSDIGNQLPKINNPLVKSLLPKFESLISQVKANDSTPEALAAYADSLPKSKFIYSSLINDLNKGMQDVKNGQNNTDYKTVLSDLMNIDADVTAKHDSTDARATQEDRNLKAIANTIKNGGLKNIPFLNSFASVARHVAAADSYNRKHAPIHTTDKNNHIKHVNHVVHVKKQRANAQHWNNVARRDRLSANNAVAAATVDAQKAERSAAAAQSFTNGLNSGSDSTSARNAARAASTDAAHASSEAAQASTDAHKAMTDSVADNDSAIISDTNEARSIADRATKDANSTASEFKVAKTTAKKAGLAPHYADQTFNNTLGHLISGYTMQKLVDHLTSNNFAKSGERKSFNDVLTQLQKLPSQLSSQKNVNDTLNKISSDLNSFHGPISKGMAKKVQSMITDVEQHDATPSTLVTYANSDGVDGELINDLNAGMHTVKDGKDNQDYKSILSDLIDLDTHPANQDHDLGEIAKTINHNHDLKIISLLKNVSRTAHQMARSANHAQQNTDGQRHAKMINDENQHRKDVISHSLISANHAASNAASIAERAVKSADAVQSNAIGLNPGSDSTLASSYATNASADADQMKDVASQASSLAHVARANDRGSANVVLNDTKAVDDLSSLVSDNASIVTTDAQGASKAAQRAGKAPQPDVEVVASVVPQILQRITAKGFDSSDFDKTIDAAKSGLSAKTLTNFLNEFDNNGSVKHFLGGNGAVTQAVTKLLNNNGALQSAYYDYHNDVNLPQILSDLEDIAAHQQVGDNLVANDQDRTAVKNDLSDVVKLVNDGRLNKIAGANDVLTAINSFNAHYKPSTKSAAKPSNVKPSLPINADFVNDVLNRLTDSQFNKLAFASAVTDGIEPALKSESTLGGFIKSIQSNSSVKLFMNNDGSLTQKIMSILKHSPKYNAAYEVAHDEVTTVNAVLSDLSDIAGQRLDNNGKNDQIDTDLDNIANVITKDSKLMKVGGMSTVAKVARDDSNNYQVVPHYADQNFNQALSDLVNNYTVQQLADHLASKRFAQSGEKKAFNQIIHDLAILPNNSDVNSDLSNISSELKNFRGPLSGKMATKVQGLIKQVEAHDSTPDNLAAYADSLNNSDGNLINDLNKGLQDVKNQPNNYDYQTVLGDLIDISQNPKREDHDLNDITKVINKGNLSKISLLANVASVAHEVAKSENSTRRHQNRPQQKKDAASQAAAKQKQAKDFAKRSAAKSAQSSAAKQHAASRKANSLAHAKHMKARSAATSAKSAHARARSVKAAAQSASVKSADSSAVSEASAAASNAFIADSSAKLAVESSNTKVSNVNSAASNVEKMYDQNKGDSSLSEDAEEASNYADQFSNDAKAASLDENKTNSADMLANSDYKATSSAANANEPSLASSYANDGSQEAAQASQYALSTANDMSAAYQASDGIASLAHDAALQSSADIKMSSADASASSAINSAKSSKASSAKSGSKTSSKASSNNDSSAIASANARANSASSASAKAAASYASLVNSYSSAIKSARTANDQSRANSLASASASASQSYSAAAESASASVSAATSAANAARASASSAESASANAERASESAHEAAVTSGIRASIASASQSAAAAERAASVSASRSASAEEAAREHSNSGAANSAESAIQSMTAKISSYANAMKSAEANRSGSNNNNSSNSGTNGNDDASASASASQSAAAAESAASVSASQSASLSASEAIASQAASASAASGNTNFTPNSGSSSFNWNPTPNNSVTPSSYNSTPSSVASQSFSSRASASQSAQPTTERVSFVNTDNPLALAVGQALKSGNAVVSRIPAHYRWFEIKRTCLAHNHIGSVGQIKDYSKVLHAGYLARVDRVFKVTEDGHTVYRYELNVHGHHYYVTGNSLFTNESYYQDRDLTARHVNHRDGKRYYQAVVRTPCLDYNSPQYSADRVVRNLYRGDMVRIKRLIKIGRPGDYMTRFELIDGTFVTANKYFLKLI